MGEFRQCLTELSAHDTIMAGYYSLTILFNICVYMRILLNGHIFVCICAYLSMVFPVRTCLQT